MSVRRMLAKTRASPVGLLARNAVPVAGGLDRHRYRAGLIVTVLGEQFQQQPVVGNVVGDVPFGQ